MAMLEAGANIVLATLPCLASLAGACAFRKTRTFGLSLCALTGVGTGLLDWAFGGSALYPERPPFPLQYSWIMSLVLLWLLLRFRGETICSPKLFKEERRLLIGRELELPPLPGQDVDEAMEGGNPEGGSTQKPMETRNAEERLAA